jgi:uracil-DNA glycosylase family 4
MDISKAIIEVKRDNLDYKLIDDNSVLVCPDNTINKARQIINISDDVERIVKSNIKLFSVLDTNLHRGCRNVNCNIKDKCTYRCSPNGNVNADFMAIKVMPSETELYYRNAFSDQAGIVMREALRQAGATDVYYTNVLKCTDIGGILPESVNECINHYVIQEICDIVKPKLVILCGQKTVTGLKAHGFLPQFSPQKLMSGNLNILYTSPITGESVKTRMLFMADFINDVNPPLIQKEIERIKPVIQKIKEVSNGTGETCQNQRSQSISQGGTTELGNRQGDYPPWS